jgi:acetyl-CoA carboxylase carboxyl transferase subunit beta
MANQGTRWFEQTKEFVGRVRPVAADEVPDLMTKCKVCSEPIFNERLVANFQICPSCGHHMVLSAAERIALLCDPGTIEVHDRELAPVDALGFVDSKPYDQRLRATQRKLGMNDAFLAASAQMDGVDIEIGAFEFKFMGGSMGSVVGECITRVFERATEYRRPAIVVSSSGGARMQEGVLSLMQMAKTCAALARLQDQANMPYISILTHPTTGGVAASFAMLGDLILAEPKALIGFAGPRVIEQTIGQELPDGFQRSEYLLDHGMVDQIVHRHELRTTVSRALRMLLRLPPVGAEPA